MGGLDKRQNLCYKRTAFDQNPWGVDKSSFCAKLTIY